MLLKRTKSGKLNSGQALIEIAIFGAVLFFLIGVLIRTHVSNSYNQNYKVRAFKMALKESFQSFQSNSNNPNPHTSRNSANILFVEDRISPDLNKYNSLDRAPFIATATATMTNLLMYPVDSDEFSQNIPIQDVFINGQHFEFTTQGFVFRTLYDNQGQCTQFSKTGFNPDPVEHDRCLRQTDPSSMKDGSHKFYTIVANGTSDYDAGAGGFDYLRGWFNGEKTKKDIPPHTNYMAWQWDSTRADGDNGKFDFGSADAKQYPSFDTSGSLREQSIYYISSKKKTQDDCKINGNDHLISITLCPDIANGLDPTNDSNKFSGPIKAVGILDPQMGDIDSTFDPNVTPGPRPGFSEEMQIYTKTGGNTYLLVKEGKLYNPSNPSQNFVRSVNSKDKTDLVSRTFQLSNDTGRFCRNGSPVKRFEDGEDNPVQACGDCLTANFSVTCFEPSTRKLYIRANLWDRNSRSWYVNATKGL